MKSVEEWALQTRGVVTPSDFLSDSQREALTGECVSYIDESLIDPKFRQKREAYASARLDATATESASVTSEAIGVGAALLRRLLQRDVLCERGGPLPEAPAYTPRGMQQINGQPVEVTEIPQAYKDAEEYAAEVVDRSLPLLTRETLEAAIREGLTNAELAQMFGVSLSKIKRAKREWNLLGIAGRRAKVTATKAELEAMLDAGMTYPQIAVRYGVHETTVGIRCRGYGLKSEHRGRPRTTQSEPRQIPASRKPYTVAGTLPTEEAMAQHLRDWLTVYSDQALEARHSVAKLTRKALLLESRRDALSAAVAAFEGVAP